MTGWMQITILPFNLYIQQAINMIENLPKLDIFRDGVWCIADIGTELYINKTNESQAKILGAHEQKQGRKVVYFYLVLIFCFMIKKSMFAYVDRYNRMTNYKNTNWLIRVFRKLCAIVRLFSYRRLPIIICQIFQLPISLGSLMVIISGIAFVLCYLFIPKFWYRACREFGSGPLAIRGGHEGIALIPLIYIISGKTNFVSSFTGISYEKLVVFHRWAAIICCFCAWVHTVPFYLQPLWEGGHDRLAWYERNEWTYYSGIPPIVFLTVLTIFSHSWIRGLWYELWLKLHWICAVGLYVSFFYHCNGWTEGTKYMVATGAFWVFQVVFKVLYKESLGINRNGIFRANKCTMKKFGGEEEEDVKDDSFFEIDIQNSVNNKKSKNFMWNVGQHCFVRIPGIRLFERHPFSIVSVYRPQEDRQNVKLILKAKGKYGITRTLYDRICENEDKIYESLIYLDGPYGGIERDLSSFTNVYLLSTGIGVSGVIPYFLQCFEMMKQYDCNIQSIQHDWIIRKACNIEWIIEELRVVKEEIVKFRRGAYRTNRIKFNIYIKQDFKELEEEEEEGGGVLKEIIELFKNVEEVQKVHNGCVVSSSDSEDSEASTDTFIEKQGQGHRCEKACGGGILGVYDSKVVRLGDILDDMRGEFGRGNAIITSGTCSMSNTVSNYVSVAQKDVLSRKKGVEEVYLYCESFDL